MAEHIFGSDAWEWNDDSFRLDPESPLEISRCLWDEMTQSEEDSRTLFSTPAPDASAPDLFYTVRIKDSTDQANQGIYHNSTEGGSPRVKRRRMLFSGPDSQYNACDPQVNDELESFTMCGDSMLPECTASSQEAAAPNPISSIPFWYKSNDNLCVPLGDSFEPVSDRWMAKCLQDGESDCLRDDLKVAPAVTEIPGMWNSESCKSEEDVLQGPSTPLPGRPSTNHGTRLSQPRKYSATSSLSSLQCLPKFTSPVAYPFTLLKPSSTEGDVTLNDINQLILTPPSRPVQHIHSPEDSWQGSESGLGLSGKSIVTRTKIHTEGNGTITIMRTRG